MERTRSMRANVLLDSPLMHMPQTLCRAYHIPVGREDVTLLRLIPPENWGSTEETDVFSFDFV